MTVRPGGRTARSKRTTYASYALNFAICKVYFDIPSRTCWVNPAPISSQSLLVPSFGRPLHRAMQSSGLATLTYVTRPSTLTYMEKTQIYFPKEELDALRKVAARSGRSVAAVVRDAVRAVILKPSDKGPVGIWDGKPKRTSLEHDSIYDEP
jgi:ribbon-helix-helix CopG family protein